MKLLIIGSFFQESIRFKIGIDYYLEDLIRYLHKRKKIKISLLSVKDPKIKNKKKYWLKLESSVNLRRWIKKINDSNFDIILFHYEPSFFFGKEVFFNIFLSALNKKCLIFIQGFPPENQLIFPEIVKQLPNLFILTRSKSLNNYIARRYSVSKSKIFYLPPTIKPLSKKNDKKGADLRLRSSLGFDKKDILFITTGFIAPYKGTLNILRIIKQVIQKEPRVKLLILGPKTISDSFNHTGYYFRCKKYIVKNKLRGSVKIISKFFNRRELLQCLKNADFFISGHVNRLQACSLTLCEALSLKKIVFTSQTITNEDLIKDLENGVLIDIKDVKKAVIKITLVLKDKDLMKTIKDNLEFNFSTNNPTSVFRRYERVIQEVLRKKMKLTRNILQVFITKPVSLKKTILSRNNFIWGMKSNFNKIIVFSPLLLPLARYNTQPVVKKANDIFCKIQIKALRVIFHKHLFLAG